MVERGLATNRVSPGENGSEVARIDALTTTRFVAALLVVIFHYGRETPPYSWWPELFGKSNCAVAYFFCLSGFVLTYVYGSQKWRGAGEFWIGRLARIWPLYVVALAIVAAQRLVNENLNGTELLLSGAMIQSWIPGYSQSLNAPGWSLANEWFFYLIFPLLLPLISQLRTAHAVITVAAICWTGSLLAEIVIHSSSRSGPNAAADFCTFHPLMHAATFIIGMCAGQLLVLHRSKIEKWGVPLAVGAFTLVFALLVGSEFVRDHHHNSLLAPLFALLILGLVGCSNSPIGRCVSHPWLVHLGEISYGIYILQFPVLIALAWVMARAKLTIGQPLMFYLYVIVLLCVSHFCYLVIEKPLRRTIRRSLLRAKTSSNQLEVVC